MSEHASAIRDLREALGLTQEQFGDRFGLARTSVVAIEKGERDLPDRATLHVDMAVSLGVSVERLGCYLRGDIKIATFMREVTS